MKSKILAIVLGGLLAASLPLGSTSVSLASGKDKSSSKPVETKLQAKLLPAPEASVGDLEGKVKYKKKYSSKKGTEEEIEAKVESSIPNESLGFVDESTAADASFLLTIFQGTTTTEKGRCILLIKEIEFKYDQGVDLVGMEADYAAKVKEKTPILGSASLKNKVGTCQAAVSVNNVPTLVEGVPDVAAGDSAVISLLTPTPGTTPLLSGIFQAGYGDDDDDD